MAHPLGRNDPCHCGSGKKYKHCCLAKDAEAARASQAEATGQTDAAATTEKPPVAKPGQDKNWQPWRKRENRGYPRFNIPRRSGGS